LCRGRSWEGALQFPGNDKVFLAKRSQRENTVKRGAAEFMGRRKKKGVSPLEGAPRRKENPKRRASLRQ